LGAQCNDVDKVVRLSSARVVEAASANDDDAGISGLSNDFRCTDGDVKA